jgi:hypothetical protein
MVATTTVVAMAMLVTLAEFRTNCVKAETTPYCARSTALKMELLLGELNSAVPVLWHINKMTINKTGDDSVRVVAITNQAAADRESPPTVRPCHPKRSDNRPVIGPRTTMHRAGGINNKPTFQGSISSTLCR